MSYAQLFCERQLFGIHILALTTDTGEPFEHQLIKPFNHCAHDKFTSYFKRKSRISINLPRPLKTPLALHETVGTLCHDALIAAQRKTKRHTIF